MDTDELVIYVDLSQCYDVVPIVYDGEDGVFIPRRMNYTEKVDKINKRVMTFKCHTKDSPRAKGHSTLYGTLAIPLADTEFFVRSQRRLQTPLIGKRYIPKAVRKDLRDILHHILDKK